MQGEEVSGRASQSRSHKLVFVDEEEALTNIKTEGLQGWKIRPGGGLRTRSQRPSALNSFVLWAQEYLDKRPQPECF
jgi:hypothetical protein